ncbi:FkbM family methyltransferase [uncultured Parasphingorhabdus sp.]|uniref:FkbM family methyltransferase n=1 Tax=uncultured Parasphingorhabdus sp. TaxID=2709694 RepID=UPI0030DCB317|tara:strand:+ start:442 stop:1170 length:729 start_codon:yes stop_codon:yes gene_type:complete
MGFGVKSNILNKLSEYRDAYISTGFFKEIAKHLTETKPVVFYVGANTGQYLRTIHHNLNNPEVFCFEPAKVNFEKLTRNASSFKQTHVHQLGLGKEKSELFVIPSDPDAMKHQQTDTMVRLSSTDTADWGESVQISTVDNFSRESQINHISILKLDVEGSETDVLFGATSYLTELKIDCVFVECSLNPDNNWHVHLDEIRAILEPLGYRIFKIYDQVSEFFTNQPHLRRADVAFISPKIYNR